jgi:hypothetical protein
MTTMGGAGSLAVLAGEQAGGLGGERGGAVGWPAAEGGDDLVVDAAGAGGGVGQVDEGVPGLVKGGDRGAGGDGLASADLAGDDAEGALGDAPGDPGGGFGAAGVLVQHGRGEVLAERQPGEAVVVAQVDHDSSAEVMAGSWLPAAGGAAAARAP